MGRPRRSDEYVIDPATGCWEWQPHRNSSGYGRCTRAATGRKQLYAHRVYYEEHVGPIPEGMELDHKCRNRGCVNPDHLRPCTHAENMQNQPGPQRDNRSSGMRGVYPDPRCGRWYARAMLNRQVIALGMYDTAEEADAVVRAWRRENMPFSELDRPPAQAS